MSYITHTRIYVYESQHKRFSKKTFWSVLVGIKFVGITLKFKLVSFNEEQMQRCKNLPKKCGLNFKHLWITFIIDDSSNFQKSFNWSFK